MILFLLFLLVGLAQLLGYLFVIIRQPRVVGEILAGIVLGPALLGRFHFAAGLATAMQRDEAIFNFFYWLGLLLLMFLSGTEARQLFGKEERREVLWLTLVGTGIPFILGLAFGSKFIVPSLMGLRGNIISLTIIIAVGTAVTSVPVISRIFSDLKILHTRFARLVLGVAVLEDIVLWLALAVATGITAHTPLSVREMSVHLLTTITFFVLGLTLVPRVIKRASKSRFNVVAKHSPVSYVLLVLLAYCVVAGALNVSMVFAAFLAGFAVVHKKRKLFDESLQSISRMSFAFFIPAYFAMVGLKLNLTRGVAVWMLLIFIGGSCLLKMVSVGIAGRFAGFRGLDLVNLAITTNARGGPGIVLASVAFDAGIISPDFYTTLVIAAVLTSQVAGAWLDYILRRGLPLNLLLPEVACVQAGWSGNAYLPAAAFAGHVGMPVSICEPSS
jgi:Kef-type K+ transport system membrane component KefB